MVGEKYLVAVSGESLVGGRKEDRSARRLDAVISRSSAGVCGLVLLLVPLLAATLLVLFVLLSPLFFDFEVARF